MKIYYDNIIFKLQKKGGISTYWTELITRINGINQLTTDSKYSRYFPVKINEQEPFIFHSSYYRICNNPLAINITTIHDFAYEKISYTFGFINKWQKKNAIMKSDGVICVSKNTAEDLRSLYPEFCGQIKVIYHGYSNKFKFKNTKRTNKCLFVGTRVFYKGFPTAVEIVASSKNLELIIIGGGELTKSEKKFLNQKILGRYQKLSYISDENLNELYNSAICLLYTSNYEGFGIPILEAQSCGCPVVCQNISSIPEVAEQSGIFIEKDNLSKTTSAIEQILTDNIKLKEIQNKGFENIKRFSWEKMAKETHNFYEKVFNEK